MRPAYAFHSSFSMLLFEKLPFLLLPLSRIGKRCPTNYSPSPPLVPRDGHVLPCIRRAGVIIHARIPAREPVARRLAS